MSSVAQFEATLGPSDKIADTTIAAVTVANTLVICTGIRSDMDDGLDEWRRQMVSVELTSSTNVRIERNSDASGSSQTLTYVIEVVEDASYSVQRGEETDSSYPNDITVTAVTLGQAAPFVHCKGDPGTGNEMAHTPASDLTSTTNLRLDVLTGSQQLFGAGKSWQLVECSRWTTQSIFKTHVISSYPHTESISAVNTSATIVTGWGLRKYDNDTHPSDQLGVYLNSSTQVAWDSYDQSNLGYGLDGWVIEDDHFTVQRGETEITTSATVDETITAVSTDNAFVNTGIPGHESALSDTLNDTDNKYLASTKLENTTTIRLQREDNTSTGSRVYWEVASFGVERAPDLMPFMPY